MAENKEIGINLTPVMIEIFMMRAELKAFADMTLTEEQKLQFKDNSMNHYKKIVKEFAVQFPHLSKNGFDDIIKNW